MSVICAINISGNVGKSTLTNELFRPRLKNHRFYDVETLNANRSPEEEQRKGREFNKIIDEIMLDHDDAFIDVGASNVEIFIEQMNENVGSYEEFDLFVIPVTPEDKQVEDTLQTIEILRRLGVPAKKITVVFNKIEGTLNTVDDVEAFSNIVFYHEQTKNFVLNKDFVVYKTEAFSRCEDLDVTIFDIINSKENYREMAKNKELTRPERNNLLALVTAKRIATNVHANLDSVFQLLQKQFKL